MYPHSYKQQTDEQEWSCLRAGKRTEVLCLKVMQCGVSAGDEGGRQRRHNSWLPVALGRIEVVGEGGGGGGGVGRGIYIKKRVGGSCQSVCYF